MGKAGKEKKDEKLWAEIAKGYIEDKAKRIHSVERNYLDELNHMKAKLETRQTKPTPVQRNRMGRGAQDRRKAGRRSRGKEPVEQMEEPQVELEGECSEKSCSFEPHC